MSLRILDANSLRQALGYEDVLDAVEQAMLLYDSHAYIMPDRMHIDQEENTLLYMPSLAGGYAATKLVSVFPKNREKQLPVIMGTVILNDGTTGEPLAILNASTLTAMRTGAIAGVASRYLSSKETDTLGVIGTGVQGTEAALSICHARPIHTIHAYNRSTAKLQPFREAIQAVFPHIQVQAHSSGKAVLESTGLLLTATNSTQPVIPGEAALLTKKCLIAIGSYKPSMQELPDAVFSLIDTLYIDVHRGIEESGDVKTPLAQGWIQKEQIATLGPLIQEKRICSTGTRVYKSVGMALFDLTVARAAFHKAEAINLGEVVSF